MIPALSVIINTMSAESDKSPSVLSNPESNCPPEILRQQLALPVVHYGFDGQHHEGLIEVNQKVEADVKAFFESALQLSFPIEKVVPASSLTNGLLRQKES